MEPFADALARHGIELRRAVTRTLQVNTGLLCNQACRHCHLEAGPGRTEAMSAATMADVIAFAERSRFDSIDLTGGAPELVPGIERLTQSLAALTPRLSFRCNLTALAEDRGRDLAGLWSALRIAVVASLPSANPSQTDAQRGRGSWDKSLRALSLLNEAGFGKAGTGLELHLVANPGGAFLPPAQAEAEERFRVELARRTGVSFTKLFTFANSPLGRFRAWLVESGNLEEYLETLASRFNPSTLEGVMCRSLVSVSWDGTLYDCDFNLAAGLPLGGRRLHVSECPTPPPPGSPIAAGDHCYACTAGAGFT